MLTLYWNYFIPLELHLTVKSKPLRNAWHFPPSIQHNEITSFHFLRGQDQFNQHPHLYPERSVSCSPPNSSTNSPMSCVLINNKGVQRKLFMTYSFVTLGVLMNIQLCISVRLLFEMSLKIINGVIKINKILIIN